MFFIRNWRWAFIQVKLKQQSCEEEPPLSISSVSGYSSLESQISAERVVNGGLCAVGTLWEEWENWRNRWICHGLQHFIEVVDFGIISQDKERHSFWMKMLTSLAL